MLPLTSTPWQGLKEGLDPSKETGDSPGGKDTVCGCHLAGGMVRSQFLLASALQYNTVKMVLEGKRSC